MAVLQYPQNLSDPVTNPATVQFQWYSRKSIQNSVLGDTIILYMPQGVSQPSTVSWDPESYGALGKAVSDIAHGRQQSTLLGAAKAIAERAGVSIISNSIADLAAKKLGTSMAGEQLTDFAGAAVGQFMNPYLTMVFKGINFRQFSFQFKFVPFRPEDAQSIFSIVQSFRKNSLPTGSSAAAFLGYPNECEIQYLWEGKPNPWLNRFKRSVCTKVDCDYTGQGMFAVMRDGFPASISLNLDFTELELVTADDVQLTASGGQSY